MSRQLQRNSHRDNDTQFSALGCFGYTAAQQKAAAESATDLFMYDTYESAVVVVSRGLSKATAVPLINVPSLLLIRVR